MGSHSSGWVEHRPLALNTVLAALQVRRLGVSSLNSACLRLFLALSPDSLPVRTRTGGTEGHWGVSCGAPEDTDFELSRGEKGREWLTPLDGALRLRSGAPHRRPQMKGPPRTLPVRLLDDLGCFVLDSSFRSLARR